MSYKDDKWTSYTEDERDELAAIFDRLENQFFSSVDSSWEDAILRAAQIIGNAQLRRTRPVKDGDTGGIVSDAA